jgi:uncharacterized membrane protein (UPF0136 family)
MRVLLDESVPRALGFELHGHFVRTAQTAGFSGLSNGKLMAAMVAASFDVLVTFDQNLPYQQNTSLPVAVIVLVAPDNRVTTAQSFVPALLTALASLPPNQLLRLHWGSPDTSER